jgi:hypothetical protein
MKLTSEDLNRNAMYAKSKEGRRREAGFIPLKSI